MDALKKKELNKATRLRKKSERLARPPQRQLPLTPGLISRRKEAERIIKRIVMKKYSMEKYKHFTDDSNLYKSIRRGNLPIHSTTIKRRMIMHPVTVKVPLYRGFTYSKNFAEAYRTGKWVNHSFASFSKDFRVAVSFAPPFSNGRHFIIVLPPGKYPAINREKFIRNRHESEITLAPGTYYMNRNKNGRVIINNKTGAAKVTYFKNRNKSNSNSNSNSNNWLFP